MKHSEIEEYKKLKYNNLVIKLLNKYGRVNGDYFINSNCSSPNPRIKRSNEGLFIHHIFEYRHHDLSKKEEALKYDYELQKSYNLVYCNFIEHILLHYAIFKEFFEEGLKRKEILGFGGLTKICPKINDYFLGYKYRNENSIIPFAVIQENYFDYIKILKNIIDYCKSNKTITDFLNSPFCPDFFQSYYLIEYGLLMECYGVPRIPSRKNFLGHNVNSLPNDIIKTLKEKENKE